VRVKTSERREAILTVALQVFREKGYSAASMAEISGRLGGSKGTLYSYFNSKEELFATAMLERVATIAGPILDILKREPDVKKALGSYTHELMRALVSAEVLDFRRIAIADGFRSGLGKLLYEKGSQVAWQAFADFFVAKAREGVFRDADPWQAAMHMEALCGAGVVQRLLEGAIDRVSDEEIRSAAHAAVDVFLRAYAAAPARRGNTRRR
jgi:AcrR family transcriptional regulator